jgi:hypothetical protein
MAQIDSSIYLQQQAPDFLGNIQKGLQMRDMLDQRKLQQQQLAEQQSVKDAYKAGVVTNPDGTTTLDTKKTMTSLYAAAPEKAYALEQQMKANDLALEKQNMEKKMFKAEQVSRILGGVKDQASWDAALKTGAALGHDISQLPKAYDPNLVQGYRNAAMSTKDQLDYDWKQKNYDQAERFKKEENAIKRQESVVKAQERVEKKQESQAKLKEMSMAQSKQLGLYKLGKEAERQYQAASIKKKDGSMEHDPTKILNWIDNSSWSSLNWLKNPKAVEQQAAMSSWVEAYLRDASGAAIPPSERLAYAKDFFPMPGDSEEVVANKATMRQQKMENARVSSGASAITNFDQMSDEQIAELYLQNGGK